MIRRTEGKDWLLFTQHEHALLAGRIAEAFGNRGFESPSARTVQGVALHDCGWPIHDERPTLNGKGEPLHVFESPVWVGCQVWAASARRAANKDLYAGLLVSIHVTHLATLAAQVHRGQRDAFELNKFQHDQVELQERIRLALHMRIDVPTNHGLAGAGVSRQEDQLRFDYHLLRAMDRVSLSLLCSEKLFDSVEIEPRPSEAAISLELKRTGSFTAAVYPWPFAIPELRFGVPCRRLKAVPFSDADALREAHAGAKVEEVEAVVTPAPAGRG
jgi:hypothetical protein